MSSYLIHAISYFDNSANEIVAEPEGKIFWRKLHKHFFQIINCFLDAQVFFICLIVKYLILKIL